MYSIVGNFFALPGKLYELIALLNEAKELGKRLSGIDATIAVPVGGPANEVSYVFRVESLAEYEGIGPKLEASEEYRNLFARFNPVLVPNTSRWHIYRHLSS